MDYSNSTNSTDDGFIILDVDDTEYDIQNFSKDFILLLLRNGTALLLLPLVGICLYCTCCNTIFPKKRQRVRIQYDTDSDDEGDEESETNDCHKDDDCKNDTINDIIHDEDDDTSVLDDDDDTSVLEDEDNNSKHEISASSNNEASKKSRPSLKRQLSRGSSFLLGFSNHSYRSNRSQMSVDSMDDNNDIIKNDDDDDNNDSDLEEGHI